MECRSETFAAEHQNVRRARKLVRDVLADLGNDAGDAALLTSELVSNAIEHAHSEVEVVVCADDKILRVEVHDGFSITEAFRVVAETEMETVDTSAPRGRGLFLVRRVATRYGVLDKGAAGKAVWFELALA